MTPESKNPPAAKLEEVSLDTDGTRTSARPINQGGELPQFLRDLIGSPPRHGDANGGVHSWIFRVARQLHAHRSQEDIFALLSASLIDCGRQVPATELWAAIDHSVSCAWRPGASGTARQLRQKQWPDGEPELRATVIHSTPWRLYDLWETSSIRFNDEDAACRWVAPQLFPADPLICVGHAKNLPRTAPLSELVAELPAFQFIVPSPMTKTLGKNQDGEDSIRCLDCTGPRRFLIVEFDTGTLEEQAALLWHLAYRGPLVMVVHSGGKSLHGWFLCQGTDEELVRQFFRYACRLGADEHNWTRCQFVRLPGGTRDNGARQSIYFYAPELLK